MPQDDELKRYGLGAGMNTDDSPEDVDKEGDYIVARNLRNTGTGKQQAGYNSNIESFTQLSGSLFPGINNIIGGGEFKDTGQVLAFRYNTNGNNQMLLYSASTGTYSVIYTDIIDSGGAILLPLNPQKEVRAILINQTFAVWWAKDLEVGYTNLKTLASGGYGTVQASDLSLLKIPCPYPPTGAYGNDAGQPANYWYGNLPQFAVQYVNADFNYTAWSTRSARVVPYQQNTPTLGADVGQNNYIIISVNIGDSTNATINLARQINDQTVWYTIKSVDRVTILAIPHTSVDVATEVYEAYNPTTNIYEYVSYGNEVPVPIDPNETDLFYDYIWPSNAGEKINGNIIGLADWNVLYPRPNTSVTVAAVGYDPNISIPQESVVGRLQVQTINPGQSGSGDGNHQRTIVLQFSGTPQTGDYITLITADIRNANNTENYSRQVISSENGNLLLLVQDIAASLPNASIITYGVNLYGISFIDHPYFTLQTFSVALHFTGETVANSIPAVCENTTYQGAIEWFDDKLRPFPIDTNDKWIVSTPSKAQVLGQAVKISVVLNITQAPVGAAFYQPVITKPPITKILDVIGVFLAFKGTWNSSTNSPSLTVNSGDIGDTYQISVPSSPAASTYHNLGENATYNTGDYITDVGGSSSTGNGQYYAILPQTFGNIAGNEFLALSLNSLNISNQNYSQDGVDSILAYDFAAGDRCTFHYWIDESGNINYFNQPCIDVAVLGYDAGTSIVKVENSSAITFSGGNILYNGNQINARNVFFRLYSPQQLTQATSSVQSTIQWFEIGQLYTVTNGVPNTLNFDILDGGVYYKTRQYVDGLQPYQNSPVEVLATDLNYSDFYVSDYHSFGRSRTYYDQLETTEQAANIITSQNYIIGSKINGLNRFYPGNIYGNSNGQTSASFGPIQIMWMRGQVLVVIQQLATFYLPVDRTYTQVNAQITEVSLINTLLNIGEYDALGVGIGLTKCFATRYDWGIGVDPYTSLPYEWTVSGIKPIPAKMSQYFKQTLQTAFEAGKRLNVYYDDYYEEAPLTIQPASGILKLIPFSGADWEPNNDYTIVPSGVTATPNGSHSTASYNATTGIVTYTPSDNYVGNDSATFTFLVDGNPITVNNCLQWTAGSQAVNGFAFAAKVNQPLSTLIYSNSVFITRNTIAAPISISAGGEYSEDGGVTWTSASGTVAPNTSVQVRQTSSASNSTETDVTLTVDGQSATFKVTTIASSPTDNFFINNNSSDTIDFVSYTGPDTGTFPSVPPDGSASYSVTAGTYSGSVKIGSGGSPGAYVQINGASPVFVAGGNNLPYTGVSTPIYITTTDTP